MRPRNLFTAGALILATAACSTSPEDTAALNDELASELELGYVGLQQGSSLPGVVSEVELTQPAPSTRPQRSAPIARPQQPSTGNSDALMLARLTVDAEPGLVAAPAVGEGIVGKVAIAVEGTEHAGHSDDSWVSDRGPVIIRGGVGANDPCKLHIPAGASGAGELLGAIGVLVNDQVPRGIGIDRNGTPRSRGTAMGGGSRFPGGIR
jgi:hypothetical protein